MLLSLIVVVAPNYGKRNNKFNAAIFAWAYNFTLFYREKYFWVATLLCKPRNSFIIERSAYSCQRTWKIEPFNKRHHNKASGNKPIWILWFIPQSPVCEFTCLFKASKNVFILLVAGKTDETWYYLCTVTAWHHSTISSGVYEFEGWVSSSPWNFLSFSCNL